MMPQLPAAGERSSDSAARQRDDEAQFETATKGHDEPNK